MLRSDADPWTLTGADARPNRTMWRLRGVEGDRGLAFVIDRAETVVGSLESSDLVLRVPGVSRQHAMLRWSGEGLSVVDLGSRNGTFVSSIAVRQQALQSGDEIRLGPVRLLVGPIDPDDATLAVTADAVDPPSGQETEWQPRPTSGSDGAAMTRSLVALLLRDGGPAVADALGLLAQHVGAAGAAFGEWDGKGEPRLLATYGDVGTNMEHPALYEFFGRVHASGALAACCETTAVQTDPPLLCGGFRRPEISLLGIVLRGSALHGDWRDGAEILLRLVDQARFRTADRDRPRIAGIPGGLAVPLGFVRGASPGMQLVYQQIDRLRDGEYSVLVRGETGVGKEHLVRLIHDSSPRRSGPFVAINCSALPAELLEAEMFGIGRGVASGVQERAGRFQEATGGTLFLDEIGEMPLPLQAKLLRALESGRVLPLGCAPVDVDVRIVAATNADLQSRISAGSFRPDLYYRISGYELLIPPLRERREDVTQLVQHFLGSICTRLRKRITGVTVGAMKLLLGYPWPGNVRELENELRRLILSCPDGQPIDSSMLHPRIRASNGTATEEYEDRQLTLDEAVAKVEARMIRTALERVNGSRSGAARLLGLSRNGLGAKMQRLGIERSRSD